MTEYHSLIHCTLKWRQKAEMEEKATGEQDLALQQHFPYNPLNYPKIQTVV